MTSQFEEDIQLPKDESWKDIEQVLFPKKNVRLIGFFTAAFILLFAGFVMVLFQKPSNPSNKSQSKNALRNQQKNAENSSKYIKLNSNQKAILKGEIETSNRVNQTPNSENKINWSISINSKNNEIASTKKNQPYNIENKSNNFSNSGNEGNNNQQQNAIVTGKQIGKAHV